MSGEIENLLWYLQDAANSICGQQGATSHQEKLLELHALLTASPPSSATPGEFEVFAAAFGVTLEPYPAGIPNRDGLRFKYKQANDAWAAWQKAHPQPQERAGSDAGHGVYWCGEKIVTTERLIEVVKAECSKAWDDGYDTHKAELTRPQPASDASGGEPVSNPYKLPVHQPGAFNIEVWDGSQWRGGMNRSTEDRAKETAADWSACDGMRYRVFSPDGRLVLDTQPRACRFCGCREEPETAADPYTTDGTVEVCPACRNAESYVPTKEQP